MQIFNQRRMEGGVATLNPYIVQGSTVFGIYKVELAGFGD